MNEHTYYCHIFFIHFLTTTFMIFLVEKFEELDDNFKELAAMLNFRDKQKDRKEFFEARKAGTLSQVDKEMDEWDKEMKVGP